MPNGYKLLMQSSSAKQDMGQIGGAQPDIRRGIAREKRKITG